LLCTISYIEFSNAKIFFPNPELLQITKDSKKFNSLFLQNTIRYLEKNNRKLKVKYNFYDDTDLIESIDIQNLKSVEDYNLITSNILELLTEIKETEITSKIERKFYSQDDKLLSIISFLDFNRIIITFVNSNKLKIQKTSELFKRLISKKILDNLKRDFPKIKTSYDFYDNTKIIDSIEIVNVSSVKAYNFVCEQIIELLSELEYNLK